MRFAAEEPIVVVEGQPKPPTPRAAPRMDEHKLMLLTIVGVVVVFLLGGAGIYYLYFVRHAELTAEKLKLEKDLKETKEKVSLIGDLETEVAGLLQDKERLERRLPAKERTNPDQVNLMINNLRNEINARQEDLPLTINYAKPVDESKKKSGKGGQGKQVPADVEKISYDIEVRGGVINIFQFMNRIESFEWFMELEDFSIKTGQSLGAGRGRGEVGEYTAKMSVTTYLFKETAAKEPEKPAGKPK